jgi:hypothetical protein
LIFFFNSLIPFAAPTDHDQNKQGISEILIDALSDAFLECKANPVRSNSQRVEADPHALRQCLPLVYLRLSFELVILQHQISVLCAQMVQTLLQARELDLNFVRVPAGQSVRLRLFSTSVLKVDLLGHSIKILGVITFVLTLNLRQTISDAVDCFVGQFFGFVTATAGEDFYETRANLFIFSTSLVSLRCEPVK